jgi:hypothetical protein
MSHGGGGSEKSQNIVTYYLIDPLKMMFTQFLSSRAGTFLSSIGTHHNMTHCLQQGSKTQIHRRATFQRITNIIIINIIKSFCGPQFIRKALKVG